MYVDAQAEFSDSQAVTATAASTNIKDLKSVLNDLGSGEVLYFSSNLTVAMTDTGSDSTMAVTLEMDDNEGFTSPTAVQTIGTYLATSAAGTKLEAQLQVGQLTERFLRVKYTITGGDLTTGSVDAFLTKDINSFRAYANGFSITTS